MSEGISADFLILSDAAQVQGEFEQGRPPGLPPGTTQRVMLAINMSIRVESACEAVAEIALDGQMAKSVPFRIVQQKPPR